MSLEEKPENRAIHVLAPAKEREQRLDGETI
jgi:hypothetical protein